MRQPNRRVTGRTIVLGSILTAYSTVGIAQTRPDAGTILDSVRPAEQAPRTGSVPALPAPPPRLPDNSALKVTVREFRISGNTLFSEDQLKAVIQSYTGRELDSAGLQAALDELKNFYRAKGYFLTVAYLPTQEINGGEVRIHVLEGRIGKATARTADGARLHPSVAERYLSTIQPGSIATESAIYAPLLLLQDLPGVDIRSSLGPGKQAGEADLMVDVGDRDKRVNGSVDFDNYGSKYSGALRLSGQAQVNSPTGYGDTLGMRALASEHAGTEVGSLSYLLPVGPWGTKIGASYTALRYKLHGSTTDPYSAVQDLGALKANGTGTVATVNLVHPIIRGRESNLYATLSGDVKHSTDRALFNTTTTNVNDQRRTVKATRAGLNGDFRDAFNGGGFNAVGLTWSSGKATDNSIDAANADDPVIGGNRAGTFTKYNIDLQRTQRINDQAFAMIHVTAQGANRNLPSSERFVVGGPTGVRAYPVGEGVADAGVMLNLEGRYNLSRQGWAVAAFVDTANVKRNINQPASDTVAVAGAPLPIGTLLPNSRTYTGGGFGLRINNSRGYTLSADVAWRMGTQRAQSDVQRNPTAWLRASFAL